MVDQFFETYGQAINRKCDAILAMLGQLLRKENAIMATIQDVQAAVAAETTVEKSVVTLLTSLSAQLAAAIAASDPTALQSVVDTINANATTLAAAVVANTPGGPPAVPAKK